MKLSKSIKIILILLSVNNFSFSQALTCEEAIAFSSIEEMDGYESYMPIENPFDEPVPFCPGSPQGSGNPQNMSWLKFIASSTEASLEITFSNCQAGAFGIQYGLYTDCNFTDYLLGTCVGDAIPVGTPVIIHMSGMTVGEDYFFFLDGDLGTYCEYYIDVICIDGLAIISQPSSLECISDNCPEDEIVCSLGETLTFEPEGLDEDVDYIWTVLPSPPEGITISGNNDFSATFDSAGYYEICVVGNNGCVETTPVCYTTYVVGPDAGTILLESDTICIGERTTVSIIDFFIGNPMIISMIAVDPDGKVIEAEWGSELEVKYDEEGIVKVYSYNFLSSVSSDFPNVGDFFTPPDCSENCCAIDSMDIVFADIKITSLPERLTQVPTEVRIFPNPFKETLKIEIKNINSDELKFSILNLKGQKVKSGEWQMNTKDLFELDLSDLSSGLYQLVMNNGDEVLTKKIIKID
ncbi:MAG: T9SS type A sorting domain-containing protein [Bacteroidota bacterium]